MKKGKESGQTGEVKVNEKRMCGLWLTLTCCVLYFQSIYLAWGNYVGFLFSMWSICVDSVGCQTPVDCFNFLYNVPKMEDDSHNNNKHLANVRDILHRVYRSGSSQICQIAVARDVRSAVIEISHDNTLSGHVRIRITLNKILAKFYWPRVKGCEGIRSHLRHLSANHS